MTSALLPGGVIAALATPIHEHGTLDHDAIPGLVAHVLAGGADGVSPVGSTGEGARLSFAQRLDVVRRVRASLPADAPLVAGAPLRNASDGVAEVSELAEAGANAVLVSISAGYPLADDDVLRCYASLADSSPLPLLCYNIPQYTGVRIAPDVVARLASHPNIAGIKDSSRDMEYLSQVVMATEAEAFTVFTGTDTLLLASLAAGAHGSIAASVNLVPELGVGIRRAFLAGDLATARGIQQRLARIVHACRVGPAPAGWKAALDIAKLCGPHLVPPASALTAAQYESIRSSLAELDVVH